MTEAKQQDDNIINGKLIAGVVRSNIMLETEKLIKEHQVTPGLGVVLVGQRTDSATYVRMKKKAAKECGFYSLDVELPEDATQEEIERTVDDLNNNDKIHAILVQLPLPKHIDEAAVLEKIKYEKDADGFSAENIGRMAIRGGKAPLALPCTPAGCIELLQQSQVETKGKHAVIIGRSNIVGMPAALLLLSMDCTVTICHSKTKDIAEEVKRADIVIAAVGRAEYVKAEWIKEGAVIIDVGINSIDDATKKRGYRLVGDVDYKNVKAKAKLITPVPGGVGPMTIAMLMKNTLNLARASVNLERIPLRKKHMRIDFKSKAIVNTNPVRSRKSYGINVILSITSLAIGIACGILIQKKR